MIIGIDASRATVKRRTGTETYSVHVIQEMLRVGLAHRFRLYTNGPAPAALFQQDEGGPVAPVEVRAIPFRRLWTHARLSFEMLADAPDVLFVPAHVLPLIHPPASVVTVHDLGYLSYPEAHKPADRRYLDWSTALERAPGRRRRGGFGGDQGRPGACVRRAGRQNPCRLPGPRRVAETG